MALELMQKPKIDDSQRAEQSLLDEYRQQRGLYAEFSAVLATLVDRVLKEGGISLHSVTHRCKEVDSLGTKVARQDRSYKLLSDVTDLAGIRVITYFEGDVDKASKLIESEFEIDRHNSIDKRSLLDPDRFGYMSLHYVLGLTPTRRKLAEYRRFENLKAEIQVRSLLQHTWAEIEHDLGYKSAHAVPAAMRRRFARLAGLLELADAEFQAIRGDLATYESQVPQLIKAHPEALLLDQVSLLAFIRHNEVIRRIDRKICSLVRANLAPVRDSFVNSSLMNLSHIGVKTAAQLEALLLENEEPIGRFSQAWMSGSRYFGLSMGIGLLYLTYVVLAKTHDREQIARWVAAKSFAEPEMIPDKVLDIAKKAEI